MVLISLLRQLVHIGLELNSIPMPLQNFSPLQTQQ